MKYSKSFFGLKVNLDVTYERPKRYHVSIFNSEAREVRLYHFHTLFFATRFLKQAAKLCAFQWDCDVTLKLSDDEGEVLASATGYFKRSVHVSFSKRNRK
jgi:hypothetical protein